MHLKKTHKQTNKSKTLRHFEILYLRTYIDVVFVARSPTRNINTANLASVQVAGWNTPRNRCENTLVKRGQLFVRAGVNKLPIWRGEIKEYKWHFWGIYLITDNNALFGLAIYWLLLLRDVNWKIWWPLERHGKGMKRPSLARAVFVWKCKAMLKHQVNTDKREFEVWRVRVFLSEKTMVRTNPLILVKTQHPKSFTMSSKGGCLVFRRWHPRCFFGFGAQNRNSYIGAIKGILNLSSNGVNVELLLSWVSYAGSG